MSKNIAILGAGWLGEPLARQLQAKGCQIKAATTRSEKANRLRQAGLTTYVFQLSADGNTQLPASFFEAEVLVLSVPPGGRRDPAVETTYPAKIKQAIAAAQAGNIQHVLFTSSTGIYGEQQGIVTEDSLLLPVTASGKALVKVEALLRDAYGSKLTILRLAGLIGGERQPGRWFAGKQDIPGGEQVVNLVHRQDVLTMIECILEENHWGHTFNVCADNHPTKAEFYPAATRALGLGLEEPTFIVDKDNERGKQVSNEQGKRLLGYEYKYDNPLQFPLSNGRIINS